MNGNDFRQVAVSWFPLALLLVVFPLQIFEGNQDSFGFDLLLLAPLLLLGIASFFFMALLLRLPSGTLRLWIAAAGFWVGLCLLLLQVVAPLETKGMAGHFDIEGIYTSGTAVLAAILVLSIVIVVALIVPARLVVGPASVFVPLCLVFLVGSSLLHVSDATIQRLVADLTLRSGSPITYLPAPKTPVEGGNVYHIILDAFVASAFPEAMRRAGATPDDFPGFTVFPRNRANYDVTHVSVPSLMSGTLHESRGLKQWQQKWKGDGLLTQAVQTGYTLWLYPAAAHYEGQRSHFLRPPSGGGRSTTAWTLLGLALMRASPPTLREWLWRDDSGLVRKAVMAAGFSGNEWVLEQVQRFRNVTADEPRRAGKGEYVYAHIYLPHGPYLLGSDCGARSGDGGDQNNRYLDQAACAVRLLGELIKELRRTN